MTPEGIKINIAPEINDDTAELALKVVQLYCNTTGRSVLTFTLHDGTKKLSFEQPIHDPKDCRYCAIDGKGDLYCYGTKEIEPCKGESCPDWKSRCEP